MANNRKAVLELYRNLIRESRKWSTYNYREYALRKVRYEFHSNKSLQDLQLIEQALSKGEEYLKLLKRQVTIGNLYKTDPLVIEVNKTNAAPNA